MVFDREFDEVLNIILGCENRNSLGIAKFMKNIPDEMYEQIRQNLNNEKCLIKYTNNNRWYYEFEINNDSNEKNIRISFFANDIDFPSFSMTLFARNNQLYNELNNHAVVYIAKSEFIHHSKKYRVVHYLKKFPSEFDIKTISMRLGTASVSVSYNTIPISNTKNELFIDNIDEIIQEKIKIIKKRNINN